MSNNDTFKSLFPCYDAHGKHTVVFTHGGRGAQVCIEGHGAVTDLQSGYWCVPLGHAHPGVNMAAMRSMYFAHPFGATCSDAIALADELCARTGYRKVLFETTGSAAVESAVRIALQATQRLPIQPPRVLRVGRGFHGTGTVQFAVGGFPERVGELRLRMVDYVLGKKEDWEVVDAFIFEPVMAIGGRVMDPEVYRKAASLVQQQGGVVIADEVSTGIGRCGSFLASEALHPKPDIVVLGKGLTNGVAPLSAVLISERVWQCIEESTADEHLRYMYGSTLAALPMACAAANETIRRVDRHMLERIGALSVVLERELREWPANLRIRAIRGQGLFWHVALEERGTERSMRAQRLALERGVYVGCEGSVLTLVPPFIIEEQELLNAVGVVRRALGDA